MAATIGAMFGLRRRLARLRSPEGGRIDGPHAGSDSVPVFLSPGRQVTDPGEAEALGLPVDARRLREKGRAG